MNIKYIYIKIRKFLKWSFIISLVIHIIFAYLFIHFIGGIKKTKKDTTIDLFIQPTQSLEFIPVIQEPIEDSSEIQTEEKLVIKEKVDIPKEIVKKIFSKNLTPKVEARGLDLSRLKSATTTFKLGVEKNLKGGKFSSRLKKFGNPEKYNNVAVQGTLLWNSVDDLDLRALISDKFDLKFLTFSKKIKEISYIYPRYGNGLLDVDKNAPNTIITEEPIENIFWKKKPQDGLYAFRITTPQARTSKPSLNYDFRLKINKVIYFFKGVLNLGEKVKDIVTIKVKGDLIKIVAGKPAGKYNLNRSINFSKVDSIPIKINFK